MRCLYVVLVSSKAPHAARMRYWVHCLVAVWLTRQNSITYKSKRRHQSREVCWCSRGCADLCWCAQRRPEVSYDVFWQVLSAVGHGEVVSERLSGVAGVSYEQGSFAGSQGYR